MPHIFCPAKPIQDLKLTPAQEQIVGKFLENVVHKLNAIHFAGNEQFFPVDHKVENILNDTLYIPNMGKSNLDALANRLGGPSSPEQGVFRSVLSVALDELGSDSEEARLMDRLLDNITPMNVVMAAAHLQHDKLSLYQKEHYHALPPTYSTICTNILANTYTYSTEVFLSDEMASHAQEAGYLRDFLASLLGDIKQQFQTAGAPLFRGKFEKDEPISDTEYIPDMDNDARGKLLRKIRTMNGIGNDDTPFRKLVSDKLNALDPDSPEAEVIGRYQANITPQALLAFAAGEQFAGLAPEQIRHVKHIALPEEVCYRVIDKSNMFPMPETSNYTPPFVLTRNELSQITSTLRSLRNAMTDLGTRLAGAQAPNPLETLVKDLTSLEIAFTLYQTNTYKLLEPLRGKDSRLIHSLCISLILAAENRSEFAEDRKFMNHITESLRRPGEDPIAALSAALENSPGFTLTKRNFLGQALKDAILNLDAGQFIGLNNFQTYTINEKKQIAKIQKEAENTRTYDGYRLSTLSAALTKPTESHSGWEPLRNVQKDSHEMGPDVYDTYLAELNGLLRRLEYTKRTVWPQKNTDGFTKMLTGMKALSNMMKDKSYLYFRTPQFYSMMSQVVEASKQYQDDHNGGKFAGKKYSKFQKIRLEVASELQLLTDLMVQNVPLKSPEACSAKMALKDSFTKALCDTASSDSPASREDLCRSTRNEMAKYEGSPILDYEFTKRYLSREPKNLWAVLKKETAAANKSAKKI